MTAQPIERTTISEPTPRPKRAPAPLEKPRFPLVWKLFGLTALLIAIVVGAAIGITIQRANVIAKATVDSSISSAAKLFEEFERQRLGRLALAADITGHDSNFYAYIQNALAPTAETPATITPQGVAPATPATPRISFADILDQAIQKKDDLGSDLTMVLDDQGKLLARSDRPVIAENQMEDLYERVPMVKKIVDDATLPTERGVISVDNHLYHAAIAPIAAGANNVRIGYFLNAYQIGDQFANRIAESTNAGVIFVSPTSVVRSGNAPQFTMQQMTGAEQVMKTGRMFAPRSERIDRSSYVTTGEPLQSAGKTVGAAVFVRSLDRELAPFKQIENTLLIGGGIALLLAFLFSWLIAKRVTRPIEQLAGVAQAVTNGDYDVHPAIDRSDEVGILARSFAKMITSLRDKAELEELYEAMAARSQEREIAGTPLLEEPKLDYGTVLVTDLRGLPATVGEGDAANVIGTVSRVMKMQETEVRRQEGFIREVVGHRIVAVFRGDRSILHAIRAARAINEELAAQGGHPPMTIGVGVATGEFVTGSVELTEESGLAIVGNAPLLALLFAWHAPSGYAYISYETAQAAGPEIEQSAQREEVRLKWLPNPLPVASMPLVSLTTGMMRAMGASTGSMATLRMDGTVPGATAPAGVGAELSAGHLFASRYRIDQILGRGGMGVVYKATDTQLDETVAIKTLPGDVMTRSPEDLERFKREIRLARKITHRNVLRTYDYGEADGVYFISMEFVRGYTLSELLNEAEGRRMSPRVALGVARQICRGLDAAHEQGIIHRDIKPQNVLIDHRGEVKLMDFGIARMAEAPEAMTQAGLIVGTPHYMSPEQVQGKELGPRSDVYSMGVMLYEMLAGVRPFESSSLTGVLMAHVTEKPRPILELRSDVGRDVNAIVMRCLEKDPKARFSDAGEMLSALDGVQVQAAA
ncbi:MAG: protein kinase [Acidobacteria bacterium]|nr:protein kinase [Acidobacteriota bacterium]